MAKTYSPNIIITGPSLAGKSYLAKCVFPDLAISTSETSIRLGKATLKTKYYSAELSICIVHYRHLDCIDKSKLEAFVFVYDKYHALDDEEISNLFDMISCPITVCVSNNPSNCSSNVHVLKVEHEHVDVNYGDVISCQGKRSQLSDETRQLEGLPRLKEALECHMWPNLVKNSSKCISKSLSSSLPHSPEQNDGEFDKFEDMLNLIRTVKEQGSSRPDDERRRLASDTITRLISAFNLESESGSDIDDE